MVGVTPVVLPATCFCYLRPAGLDPTFVLEEEMRRIETLSKWVNKLITDRGLLNKQPVPFFQGIRLVDHTLVFTAPNGAFETPVKMLTPDMGQVEEPRVAQTCILWFSLAQG